MSKKKQGRAKGFKRALKYALKNPLTYIWLLIFIIIAAATIVVFFLKHKPKAELRQCSIPYGLLL